MIDDPEKSLAEIAAQTGFSDQSHFFRAFRPRGSNVTKEIGRSTALEDDVRRLDFTLQRFSCIDEAVGHILGIE
jgi:hypothetical protein